MSDSPSIDICICTYRRTHILLTLQSIAAMHLPDDCKVRVIVADNDTGPSAQVSVLAAAEELGLNLVYLHAPAQNISVARNACLDAATASYIAFIDDDEWVHEDWLIAMMGEMEKTGADVVLGPVQAIYPPDSSHWLVAGDFHSTRPVWRKGAIVTGYTGNVCMRRSSNALQGLRFNESLGTRGGEDTDFFYRAYCAGATIAHAPEAIAMEQVPTHRATLGWLIRRRWRYGETHATTTYIGRRFSAVSATIAGLKALICFAALPVMALHPVRKRLWLLRGVFHAGVAYHLILQKLR